MQERVWLPRPLIVTNVNDNDQIVLLWLIWWWIVDDQWGGWSPTPPLALLLDCCDQIVSSWLMWWWMVDDQWGPPLLWLGCLTVVYCFLFLDWLEVWTWRGVVVVATLVTPPSCSLLPLVVAILIPHRSVVARSTPLGHGVLVLVLWISWWGVGVRRNVMV